MGLADQPANAFVPGFRADVFISYGHVDNQTGWVSAFQAKLEERLTVVLGLPPIVWRDTKRMDGLDPVWDTITGWVTKAAMFVTILSPRYVQSPSCLREMDLFVHEASTRPSQVSVASRIVRIVKFPYSAVAPAALKENETVGYAFNVPRDDTTYREFSPANPEFDDAVDRVAQAMANRLMLLRREQEQAVPKVARAVARRKIFLADVTSDRRLDRETLTKELGRNHEILMIPKDTDTRAGVEAETAKLLAQTDYAIHILGDLYGTVPEGTERSMVELEYRTVRRCAGQSPRWRQIVFVPDNLSATETRQRSFTDLVLGQDPDVWGEGMELIRGGQKDLLEAVKDMIESDAQGSLSPVRSKSVYVMCTQADLNERSLQVLRSYIFGQGYPNETSAFEDGFLDLAEVERRLILGSSGTLIYYGSATDAWVKIKRKTLLKILGDAQAAGEHVRALYLDTPPNQFKQAELAIGLRAVPEVGAPPLLLLGDCGPFVPNKVQPFLDRL